jgi:putative hydrolase of the HAD superfamily
VSCVLVLDLDDTLFPEHEYALSGFRAVGRFLEEHHGVREFHTVAWLLFEEGVRGKIFNEALDRLGVPYDGPMIERLVSHYREHLPEINLHEDARWALMHYGKTFRLGLITDGPLVVQRNKVAALGIEPHFAAIVYSDEYGRESWKPSPVPYRKIMELIPCEGDGQYIYVGDNPRKDFVTAKLLGWSTVQIVRERGEYSGVVVPESHHAHARISSLRELEQVIDAVLGASKPAGNAQGPRPGA